MRRVYRTSLVFRLLFALFAFGAALVAPIGGVLALGPAPPADPSDFLPGLAVGMALGLAFAYLSVRGLRLGIVVEEETVCLCGPLWNTRIAMSQIASIGEEERSSEGTSYTLYVARDASGRELFGVMKTLRNWEELVTLLQQVAQVPASAAILNADLADTCDWR